MFFLQTLRERFPIYGGYAETLLHTFQDCNHTFLYHSLSLIWGKGVRKVVVESGAKNSLHLIEVGSTTHHSFSHIVDGIRNIIMEEGVVS